MDICWSNAGHNTGNPPPPPPPHNIATFRFFFQINVVFLVCVLRAIIKTRRNKHHKKLIKGKKKTNENVETAK